MAVIDVCTYNGEKELWDIHYNVLKDYVDEFIVVEFDKTFAGEIKEPLFKALDYPKVRYFYNTEDLYGKYRELANQSPNTIGAEHWKLEFCQKESIKDTLTHLQDDDIVFIGDVDEVWDPKSLDADLTWEYLHRDTDYIFKLKLRVYTYWLNNFSNENFWGPIAGRYGKIKDKCLNHIRSDGMINFRTGWWGGWHFTSMGGTESVKKKLTDSYTQESYATPAVLDNLEYNMAENKDFLGRTFTYTTDESEWPAYLKENREKYKHLIK